MADKKTALMLDEKTYELRKKLLELAGAYNGAIHIGGDLSSAEILTVLFQYGLNISPDNVMMPTRDRFILSKGHAAICMYIAMAIRGFFDYDEILRTYGKLDSAYGMHPCKIQLPGVEISSGSLGQGLAIACGMAMDARDKGERHRVFCLMGDGESCEGEVWETAFISSSYKLGNLIGIVDRNKQFMTSYSGDFIDLEPYADKWRAFGWNLCEVNGHDVGEIADAIDNLPPVESEKPTLLLCNTLKGKGVSFMEKALNWHSNTLTPENMEIALAEIAKEWENNKELRS